MVEKALFAGGNEDTIVLIAALVKDKETSLRINLHLQRKTDICTHGEIGITVAEQRYQPATRLVVVAKQEAYFGPKNTKPNEMSRALPIRRRRTLTKFDLRSQRFLALGGYAAGAFLANGETRRTLGHLISRAHQPAKPAFSGKNSMTRKALRTWYAIGEPNTPPITRRKTMAALAAPH